MFTQDFMKKLKKNYKFIILKHLSSPPNVWWANSKNEGELKQIGYAQNENKRTMCIKLINSYHMDGNFSSQVNQSLRYVHSYLELIIPNKMSTNNPSQK